MNLEYVTSSDSLIIRAFNVDPIDYFSSFYITYYAPGSDPNEKFAPNVFNQASETSLEYENLKYTEEVQHILKNTIGASINSHVSIEYTLSETSTLNSNPWNEIGFAYQYDTKLEILQDFGLTVTTFNSPRSGDPLIEVVIHPSEFKINATKEQKVSTMVSGFAQLGGVFSLIVAIKVLLFGFRPSSPWGVVYHLPFRRAKESLAKDLVNEFNTLNTPIPIAIPVHTRFKSAFGGANASNSKSIIDNQEIVESDCTRLRRLEERFQLMEVLFKHYYINDEIFQQLNNSRKKNDIDSTSGKSNKETPSTQTSRIKRDSEDIV